MQRQQWVCRRRIWRQIAVPHKLIYVFSPYPPSRKRQKNHYQLKVEMFFINSLAFHFQLCYTYYRRVWNSAKKTTDFRVNLCCFSTVGISGLQPHAQLRSIYILRLCMRLFCPHTFLMPHVYRHNRERPTSIYSSKYRCSAVIIIVLYGSITLSGGIPRSTAQKRINKKASPRSRYPYSG